MALGELCRVYWYPIYAYIRRHGHGKEDAEDLAQSFFSRFFQKNYLEGLSGDKGKFRAFLLASLKHYLANEWARASRKKRGGGIPPIALDWNTADEKYNFDVPDVLSTDKLYDRAWATTLLERVVECLRKECETDGKLDLFTQLKPLLTAGRSASLYSDAAKVLIMTEGAVRNAGHRLRVRYRELLRDEISQTLSNPSQVEEELKSLLEAFV